MLVSRSEKKLDNWAWLFHLAGLTIAIAIFAASLLLVIWPLDRRQAVVRRKMQDLKQVFELEEDIRDQHEILSRDLQEADAKIDQLLNSIPVVPREADFLGQITTLAHDVDLEIVDYRPGVTVERAEYQEMLVTISSEGNYAGVCSFLQRVDHLPRLSRVNELKIAPRPDGKTFSMDMTLAIYFAPKNKLAGMQKEPSHE